jgi:hypothetical protein
LLSLVECAGNDCTNPANWKFNDVKTTCDTWGNPDSVTTHTGLGVGDTLASSGAAVTATCYGSGTAPTCNPDAYHTYPAWQLNALGHPTTWTYNKAFGLPESETDANNITTYAAYDNLGRLVKIARAGDDLNSPTIALSYNDDSLPFYTTAVQKINATQSSSVRKVYDGLGRLVQSQRLGAMLAEGLRDVLVDAWYDGDGNRVKGMVAGVTTVYIGNYFEWMISIGTKYFYAGNTRVAMRTGARKS